MHKLYLDIDGVLLKKDGSLPEGAIPFLRFVVTHFNCHWLTTHCKGDAQTAVRYLLRAYPSECQSLLESIKPTHWDGLKTEGIDFSGPFFWLDDQPFETERRALAFHQAEDTLIVVDLGRPNELARIMAFLQRQ